MFRKLNLKKTAGQAAIAALALSAPASVNANHAGEPCPPEGVQMVKSYCAAYWNASWQQPRFTSQAACEEYYMPACHDVYYISAPKRPAPLVFRET
jgi:hypothetical protein